MRRLILAQKIIDNNIPSTDVPNMPGIPSLPESEVGVTNRLYYTSTDNAVVNPYSSTAFGSTIISNEFNSDLNMYVIEFDGEVTSVNSNAFRNRSNLLNVIMPNSVTTIGDRAFYYCSNLGSINTGENVTTIGASAFSTCNLTNLSLGPNLTSIGTYAFYGCEALEKVYCRATTPPKGGYSMFEGVSDTCKIYVPTSSVDAYKSANYWSNYSDMIIAYDF